MILVVLACVSMTAQNSIVNNPNNKAYFGLRIGGDVTCPGDITADNVGVSVFSVGGGVEFGGIYNILLPISMLNRDSSSITTLILSKKIFWMTIPVARSESSE